MNKETIYDANWFINKFESFHEDRWLVRCHSIGNNGCANGLCQNYFNEAFDSLCTLFENNKHLFTKLHSGNGTYQQMVNNGGCQNYQQETAKQRILAALYDIKKITQPQPIPEPKVKEVTRTVYVSVSETLKPQAKELITNQN